MNLGIFLKKYLWVANLLGVMFCAYFLAKMAAVFIADKLLVERKFTLSPIASYTPPSKAVPTFDQYKIVIERNFFDSKDVAAPTTTEEAITAETPNLDGPAVKTNLSIKLLSTFSVGAGSDQRSTATVQSGSGAGTADVYTVGDEKQFSPGVKITKILPDRIEFINGGRLEYAEIEKLAAVGVSTGSPLSKIDSGAPKGSVKGSEGGKFVVDQAEIDNAMNNLDKLFTEVRAVPNFVGGKPAGIKLLSMTPTSLFAKLGLQRGDVIEQINGVEIDMKRGFEIFNQLKSEKSIKINLQRNGQKQTLDYEIR